jgi:translocator protein
MIKYLQSNKFKKRIGGKMKLSKPLMLTLCVVGCLIAGIIGSFFTTPSIKTWYADLVKPAFNPPNWLFGPVWTLLYILMGVSLYLYLQQWKGTREQKTGLAFFGIQLVLNALWSIIFFGLHMPLLAFAEIILLWMSILLTLLNFRKVSKAAAWLLVPYLMWVSFASALNFAIYFLN